MRGDVPRAEIQRAAEGRTGIADANGDGADDRALDRCNGARDVCGVRIDDQIHRALSVKLDFPRAMPRHQAEPQSLEYAAQCLRFRRGKFDVLDAIHPDRIVRFRHRLSICFVVHPGSWSICQRWRAGMAPAWLILLTDRYAVCVVESLS